MKTKTKIQPKKRGAKPGNQNAIGNNGQTSDRDILLKIFDEHDAKKLKAFVNKKGNKPVIAELERLQGAKYVNTFIFLVGCFKKKIRPRYLKN
jgi:hypothetical protein